MKNTKKILCVLLAAMTLCGTLAACAGGEEQNVDTTAAPGALSSDTTAAPETELTDGLPEANLNGWELTILNYDDAAHSFSLKAMDPVDLSGEPLNDAMYERNRTMETRFNCVINEVQDGSKLITNLTNSVLANNQSYDVAMIYDRKIGTCITSGIIAEWNEQLLPYVNLDNAWWNADANACFRIDNKQYAAVGDHSMSMYSKAYVMFLNKNLYGSIGDVNDLYKAVKDGSWTIDKMLTMTAGLAADLDNDAYDADDQFGVVGGSKVYFQTLLSGAGIKLVDTDSAGNPYFAIADNEKAINTISKIVEKHSANPVYYNNTPNKVNSGIVATEFVGNRAGLLSATVWDYNDFRDVDFSVGILPAPKFDEAQENYYSISIAGVVTTIPKDVAAEDAKNASLLLEAMAFYSREKVLPIYKEVVLQAKYADAANDSDMIDIIFNTMTYDLGTTVWNDEIRMPLIEKTFHNMNTECASFIESVKKLIQATIQSTINAVKD